MIESAKAYNEDVLSEKDLLVIRCEVERLFQYVENAVLVARDRREGSGDIIQGEKMLPTECEWSDDFDGLLLAWEKTSTSGGGKEVRESTVEYEPWVSSSVNIMIRARLTQVAKQRPVFEVKMHRNDELACDVIKGGQVSGVWNSDDVRKSLRPVQNLREDLINQ